MQIGMRTSVCDRVENIAGKEENTGYQHFILCQQSIQKTSNWGMWDENLTFYHTIPTFNNPKRVAF